MKSRYMKIAIILVFFLGYFNLGFVIAAMVLLLIILLKKKEDSKVEEPEDSYNKES